MLFLIPDHKNNILPTHSKLEIPVVCKNTQLISIIFVVVSKKCFLHLLSENEKLLYLNVKRSLKKYASNFGVDSKYRIMISLSVKR